MDSHQMTEKIQHLAEQLQETAAAEMRKKCAKGLTDLAKNPDDVQSFADEIFGVRVRMSPMFMEGFKLAAKVLMHPDFETES